MKKSSCITLLFSILLISLLASCSLSSNGSNQNTNVTEPESATLHEHSYGEGVVIPPSYEADGYTEYTCEGCGETYRDNITQTLTHSFSDVMSFDETSHWYSCIDEGFEDLRLSEAEHVFEEEIIKDSTADEVGSAWHTCFDCSYSYETVIPRKTHLISRPDVDAKTYYVGQSLSSVGFSGGEASVAGSFAWKNPDALLTENGEYEIVFTPTDPDDAPISTTLTVQAKWLTLKVITDTNGSSNIKDTLNVSYGQTLDLVLSPNFGYVVGTVNVNGKNTTASTTVTLENITENKTVQVGFQKSSTPFEIDCLLGNDGRYSVSGDTLTITGISTDTIYALSGVVYGNIVIDIDPQYSLELELHGLSLTSSSKCPISVVNGNKVTISAKKGYKNYINDLRTYASGDDISSYPAAIYSLVDLDVEGKGELTVSSQNNGGIYSKKDVELKNLTLSVTCRENAIRGNDSVSFNGGAITLITTHGDAVKTSNSDISSKGNQRGNITVTGSILTIYSAEDAIEAEHDVIITDGSSVVQIFTDSFSEFSVIKNNPLSNTLYLRSDSKNFTYSVRFTANGKSAHWENATLTEETIADGKLCCYYAVAIPDGYTGIEVFAYSADQSQGQDAQYYLKSECMPINHGYDAVSLKFKKDGINLKSTNYLLQNGAETVVLEHSSKGIKAGNSISISGGNITIKSHDDAIRALNSTVLENGYAASGDIVISGGKVTVNTYATAINADGNVTVSGGILNVESSYIAIDGDVVNTIGSSSTLNAVYMEIKSKQ